MVLSGFECVRERMTSGVVADDRVGMLCFTTPRVRVVAADNYTAALGRIIFNKRVSEGRIPSWNTHSYSRSLRLEAEQAAGSGYTLRRARGGSSGCGGAGSVHSTTATTATTSDTPHTSPSASGDDGGSEGAQTGGAAHDSEGQQLAPWDSSDGDTELYNPALLPLPHVAAVESHPW
jgi:hypothetical protein